MLLTTHYFYLQTQVVKQVLRNINVKNSAGLDKVPDRVLRDYARELAEVFANTFILCVEQANVPVCLKPDTIFLVPKQIDVSSLNNNRPVTTSYWSVLKDFVGHIKSIPCVVTMQRDLHGPHKYSFSSLNCMDIPCSRRGCTQRLFFFLFLSVPALYI